MSRESFDPETEPDSDTAADVNKLGFSAVRQGDEVVLTAPEGTRVPSCGVGSPRLLVLRDAGTLWLNDDRPPEGTHAGYYVDDTFVGPSCNLGCDASICIPLSRSLPVAEYVEVGVRAVPPGYQLPEGFPCRSRPRRYGNAGVDAGPPELPVFERRATTAELVVRLSICQGESTFITVPVDEP